MIAGLLVLMWRQLKSSYDNVRAEDVQVVINWPLMVLSIVGQAAGLFAMALAWYRGLVALGGGQAPWHKAVFAFASTNLVRYAPGPVGKALLPMARAAALKPYGVPVSVTLASIALESICTILMGFVIFAVTIPFQAMSDPTLRKYAWLCLLALPLLGALHPAVFQWLVRKMGKLFKEEVAECRISVREQATILLWWLGMWVLTAGSFCPYVMAVHDVPLAQAPLLAASYAFAWVMSMVLIVSPAGLGIREAILTPLLQGPVGALGGILAFASRVWNIVAEALYLLVVFLIYLAMGGRGKGEVN